MLTRINNEPVVTAGAIIGAIMAALTAMVALGVIDITPEQVSAIEALLVALVPLILSVVGAVVARRYVTPVANPRDNDGNELVARDA